MGMESQSVDHETEAFKVLQVIEQRAWALGDEQYARLAKEAMDHLSLATTQPAEQSGASFIEPKSGLIARLVVSLSKGKCDARNGVYGVNEDGAAEIERAVLSLLHVANPEQV